jgi:hypothetical protein
MSPSEFLNSPIAQNQPLTQSILRLLASSVDLLDFGVTPESLEQVELASCVMEHMNNHVDVVKKHPSPMRVALDVPFPHSSCVKPILNRV